ncbi:cobyrinate a,c-diamide synthase [Actinoplanes sp. CA-054009]
MSAQPRLVVSAPASGHGKTAIAVGLLAATAARGIPAAGFKVGPDHTDAAYLGLAAGRPGRNLDPRLVGAQRIAPLFLHGAGSAQLSVIEGAMGLFDSLTGQPEIDGTAAVAAALHAPVVLVVDVAAMGHSLAALVHGFRMFDEMVHLGGVILNRVASPRHEQMLRTALDDIGMPVLGALRRGDLPNVLPARAHGPVPVAHRTVEASRAVRRLGEAVAGALDLDRLMALATSAPALPGPIWTPADVVGGEVFDQRPVVALAGGPGAPFTYVETAELLTAAGADVAVVDPLRDESLPAGTRALIVGAGLPEGYAEELSANRRLGNAVAQFARDGWPVVAEGVALPWLGREFDGRPMCGVFDASATTADQTIAGYREATAPTTSTLAPAGARITGYKQHRAIVTPRAGTVPAWTWSGGNPEGFVWRQVHASQLGLHWAAAPEIAKRIVSAALAGPAPMAPPSRPQMPPPPQPQPMAPPSRPQMPPPPQPQPMPPAQPQPSQPPLSQPQPAQPQPAQSHAAQSYPAESHAAQSQAAQSYPAESHAAQSQAAQSYPAESHAAQSQAAQSHAAQSQAAQSHAAQSHAAQSQAAQSHAAQSHAAQSHAAESHPAQPQTSPAEPLAPQPISAESQPTQSFAIPTSPAQPQQAPSAPPAHQPAPAPQSPVYPQALSERSPDYAQPASEHSSGYAQPAAERSPGYGQPTSEHSPGYAPPAAERSPGYAQPGSENSAGYSQPAAEQSPGYPQSGSERSAGYPQPVPEQSLGYAQPAPVQQSPGHPFPEPQGYAPAVEEPPSHPQPISFQQPAGYPQSPPAEQHQPGGATISSAARGAVQPNQPSHPGRPEHLGSPGQQPARRSGASSGGGADQQPSSRAGASSSNLNDTVDITIS